MLNFGANCALGLKMRNRNILRLDKKRRYVLGYLYLQE